MRLRSLIVLPLLLASARPVFAGPPACIVPVPDAYCREGDTCASSFRGGDDRLVADAAAVAGVTKEAFAARLERAAAEVATSARAVAQAQGLDAASTERYVAARVSAFASAERRRLMDAASPETRAALGMTPGEMGASATAGVLVVLGALTVVFGSALRMRRDLV